MWKFNLAACLGAGLLVIATFPASATSTASTTMTDIKFELTDLDPNDGIAPALTFANGIPWAVYGYAADTLTHETDTHLLEGRAFGTESGAVDAARNFASIHSGQSGDPFLGTAAMSAQGAAERTGYGLGWATLHGDFTLTPNTRLTVTAHVTMVGATGGDGVEEVGSNYFLNVIGAGASNTLSHFLNAGPLPGDLPGVVRTYSFDQLLSATVSNVTAASAAVSMDIGTNISVINNMAVPEPGSWALMGLGLAGLWAAHARRGRLG